MDFIIALVAFAVVIGAFTFTGKKKSQKVVVVYVHTGYGQSAFSVYENGKFESGGFWRRALTSNEVAELTVSFGVDLGPLNIPRDPPLWDERF